MNTYPLFVPPPDLSGVQPRDWSARQADQYMHWLISVIDQRTDALLSFYGESYPRRDDVEPLLSRIGAKAVETLRQREFSASSPSGPQLTDRGFALAADLGLLTARLLLEHGNGSEQWTVQRRPKSDAFYNHPVLAGFGPVPLEPVGGSIAEAHAVLRGDRSADAWKRIFSHWRAKVPGSRGGE